MAGLTATCINSKLPSEGTTTATKNLILNFVNSVVDDKSGETTVEVLSFKLEQP